MCGITGFYGVHNRSILKESVHDLSHRGPDSNGIFFDEQNIVGLGHSRLSILDLSSAAHQPMVSHDNQVVISYNGEIYNYLKLRSELESKGYVFKSSSDTEVVLNMFLEFGISFLSRLNGIFALAIYEKKTKDLYLARDALGVKPLYYSNDKKSFSFSSEIKALLRYLPDNPEIDHDSLYRYLTFLWCPGKGTPISSVSKVLPGEVLIVNKGTIKDQKVWYKLPSLNPSKKLSNVNSIINQLKINLRNSVERQLVSDVPVGAFLSGGLDSSAIVAIARESIPNLQCFTIEPEKGNDDGDTSDLPYAIKVADHLGVPLEVVKTKPEFLVQDLEKMIWQLDEPLADPAPLNVLYISQIAKRMGIKVLLSGSGGDDIFTGYRRHQALNYEKYWKWLPKKTKLFIEKTSEKLDHSKPLQRRASKLFKDFSLEGDHRIASYFAWIQRDDLLPIFNDDFLEIIKNTDPFEPMTSFLKEADTTSSQLDKMLLLEQRFFLADHNLIYTDKMSMAAGIEVRVPFLDLELVEFASKIPDRYKQNGNTGKWILKKSLESFLPHNVVYRPKTGFGAPIRRWLRHDIRGFVADLLSEESIKKRGLFNHDKISIMLNKNDSMEKDFSYTIFSLLCIEIWCRKFIDRH